MSPSQQDSGREAAHGAPRRAERTAKCVTGLAFADQPMTELALAGASTVGLGADRTRPGSFPAYLAIKF